MVVSGFLMEILWLLSVFFVVSNVLSGFYLFFIVSGGFLSWFSNVFSGF